MKPEAFSRTAQSVARQVIGEEGRRKGGEGGRRGSAGQRSTRTIEERRPDCSAARLLRSSTDRARSQSGFPKMCTQVNGAIMETEPATSCCPSYQLLCGFWDPGSECQPKGCTSAARPASKLPRRKLLPSGPQLGRFRIGCTIHSGRPRLLEVGEAEVPGEILRIDDVAHAEGQRLAPGHDLAAHEQRQRPGRVLPVRVPDVILVVIVATCRSCAGPCTRTDTRGS